MVWQEQRHEVEAVVARWQLPEGPAFRILAGAGCLFDLYYDEGKDRWTVHPYGTPRAVGNEDSVLISG